MKKTIKQRVNESIQNEFSNNAFDEGGFNDGFSFDIDGEATKDCSGIVDEIAMAFATWLNDKGIFFNGNPERVKSMNDLYTEFKIEKGI